MSPDLQTDEFSFSDDTSEDEESANEIPKEQRVLRTQAYDKSISDIIRMIREGDVILDPEYQRNYVWDNTKSSLLIESILLNVPIPVIYVSETEDNKWVVVDGLQRLSSLRRFFDNDYKLSKLEVLTELNGSQHSTLPPKASRILSNGILRIIVILKESHPEIKYDIFMRLNRGAVKLNEQELRNCLYRGSLNDLVMSIRNNKEFLQLLGLKTIHKRMADAELILRYLALSSLYNYESGEIVGYSGKAKTTLNKFCDENKNISKDVRELYESRFKLTVNKIFSVLGSKGFQRVNADGTTDGRVNRALMDCIMLSFEHISYETLKENQIQIRSLIKDLPFEDKDFNDSITLGTADRKRLTYRIKTFTGRLKEICA